MANYRFSSPYICGQCGKRFTTMDKLNAHLAKYHKEAYNSVRQVTPGLCTVNGQEAMRHFPVEDY